MGKEKIVDLVAMIYKLLKNRTPEDRSKIITAALALCGDSASPFSPAPAEGIQPPSGKKMKAADYFEEKDPKDKGEQLAVAARFLELSESKEHLERADFKRVFDSARINFNDDRFARDISNSTIRAKFFLSGGKKKQYKLSLYGQKFVDTLPNHAEAKKIKRPKDGRKIGKKAQGKNSKKKKSK
ncbi:MAG: hypothetical protein E3J72_03580 [Planctomycetota bacterium]|nr:MAG: hypothetical protein E3J72_03580 [Planctomycetota bacterium]